MPRVTELPSGWRRWSPAEKIAHALKMSLDGVAEVLSWPPGELDPHRLNVWAQVVRVAWMIGAKTGLEVARERDRQRVLDELDRKLRERAEQTAGANRRPSTGGVTVRGKPVHASRVMRQVNDREEPSIRGRACGVFILSSPMFQLGKRKGTP
jgi:hypothetical protein